MVALFAPLNNISIRFIQEDRKFLVGLSQKAKYLNAPSFGIASVGFAR